MHGVVVGNHHDYNGSMNLHSEPDLKSALKHWKLRQKHDGYLVWVMLVMSVYPVIRFLVSPTGISKFVMVLFLCGLALSCLRLLKSAANVIVLRRIARVTAQ